MHKLSSLVFCMLSLQVARGQFGLSGNSDSSSSYPRIKLAGPLGQLIGGQGISLNSGLGQVLSSIISSAANGGQTSGGGGGSGSALSQLATAASTNYMNVIRSLPPFNQFAQANGQQNAQPHSQFGQTGPAHQFAAGAIQNPLSFLNADSGLYGAQGSFENNHFGGQNAFAHFPSENYFAGGGGQFGSGYNHGPSNPMGSSALYQGGSHHSNHGPHSNGGHSNYNLDK